MFSESLAELMQWFLQKAAATSARNEVKAYFDVQGLGMAGLFEGAPETR